MIIFRSDLSVKGKYDRPPLLDGVFREVYDNKSFTFLYDEKQYWDRYAKFTNGEKETKKNAVGTTFLAMENVYVEKNDSWYADSPNHPKKYFNDVDDLLRFIYKYPMIPQYLAFSPGHVL